MRYRPTALLLCVGAATASAQGPGSGPCRGQRIDSIAVFAEAPTVTGLQRVPFVGSVVRTTHVITRRAVVRGYLLFEVGDRCTELRRRESERILRAQPFLADADIVAVPNRRGGITVEVRTIDEASLILSGSLGSGAPSVRSVRGGSANLAGLGIATSLAWRHEPVLEDRLDFRFTHFQFGGQPYVLTAATLSDPLGHDNRGELTLPFRTDLQRYAWRTYYGESRNHALFIERDSGRLALGFGRQFAEAGFIGRVGPPGRLSLFGLSVTNERSWPDSAPKRIDETGFHPDTAFELVDRFQETRVARVNALLGVRGIRFVRARGLDALRGSQDLPLGLQFGTLVGRGVPILNASTNDLFVASDLYLAFGTPRMVYRLQLQGEGRRAQETGQWDGLVGSGRLIGYARVGDRRTRTLSLEWAGTSRVLVPHALSLGVPDGGIRGFRNANAIGGRRAIARFSEQVYVGAPFSFGDFGFAIFTDAGQLWRGDLPYGVGTPIRSSAGASLLLAVPMRSTRMWRLEFAAPLNREPGTSQFELRLSHSDRTSFFWREPPDVDAARARAVPASIYNWP